MFGEAILEELVNGNCRLVVQLINEEFIGCLYEAVVVFGVKVIALFADPLSYVRLERQERVVDKGQECDWMPFDYNGILTLQRILL